MDIKNGQYDIFFLDYGDGAWIEEPSMDNLYPMPNRFLHLPAEAIECSLAHVQPWGSNWTVDDGEALLNLARDTHGTNLIINAKVCPTRFNVNTGMRMILYSVNFLFLC